MGRSSAEGHRRGRFVAAGVPILLAASALGVSPAGARPAVANGAPACGAVSAAAVSAIVGYQVPAPSLEALHIKASAANHGISANITACLYGSDQSLTGLAKAVELQYEVASKPLTPAEVESSLASKSLASLNVTVTSVSGLGVPAISLTMDESGIHSDTVAAIVGVDSYGATVYQTTPMSEILALAKLATKL